MTSILKKLKQQGREQKELDKELDKMRKRLGLEPMSDAEYTQRRMQKAVDSDRMMRWVLTGELDMFP